MYVDQQGYIWPKCTPLRDPNIIQLREHDGSAKCPSHAKNKAGRVKFSSSGSLIWFNDLNSAAWARVTHYAVVGDA